MKKVVLASLLAFVAIATGVPSRALAQAPAPAPAPAAGGAPACPPMADAEYQAYTNAVNTAAPPAKAAALEVYLPAFPKSCVKLPTMIALMQTSSQAG